MFFNLWKKKMTDEEVLYRRLIELTGDGELTKEGVELAQGALRISVQLVQVEDTVAQVVFRADSPLFDETLCEQVAAMGSERAATLERAAENYFAAVLTPLLAAAEQRLAPVLPVNFYRRRLGFRCYQSEVVYSGFREERLSETVLFDVIKDDLPEYLGAKQVYLVKIYASFSVDDYICEVRINNRVNGPLTALIARYARSWREPGQYYTEKQCVVLCQSTMDYLPCPYTKDDILAAVDDMLPLFLAGETWGEKFYASFPDTVPAAELYALIPEIVTGFLFAKIPMDDHIVLMGDHGENFTIHQSQMRLYGYTEEAVGRYLETHQLDSDALLAIVGRSARGQALNAAVEDGAEIEDLTFEALGFPVGEGYCLY